MNVSMSQSLKSVSLTRIRAGILLFVCPSTALPSQPPVSRMIWWPADSYLRMSALYGEESAFVDYSALRGGSDRSCES
jgi:hypothetical protein